MMIMRFWYRRLRSGAHLARRVLADLPQILRVLVIELKRYGPRAASQYTVDHLVRLSSGAPPKHFSRITSHMHVGGQYTGSGWRRLQKRGITAVVNMRDEFDDAEAGIAPENYLFLPTVDDTPPTIAQLSQGVRFIHKQIEEGGQVYVHCMLGVGRSVTLVAAYLVSTGMTPAAAWRAIRRRRPFIRPTLGQQERLVEFAEQCQDMLTNIDFEPEIPEQEMEELSTEPAKVKPDGTPVP